MYRLLDPVTGLAEDVAPAGSTDAPITVADAQARERQAAAVSAATIPTAGAVPWWVWVGGAFLAGLLVASASQR